MKLASPRLQTALVVIGAVALLWLAMPLIPYGGRHPFDSPVARLAVLAGIGAIGIQIWAAWQKLKQRRNAKLFEQLQGDTSATDALAERFGTAMALLRSGIAVDRSKPTRWWRRRRQIYQLPWYVFIGAPGAGKTTALLHAGLRFPLAERLGAAPVAGVGGTRQCDWWFTDQAVFLDTAGRYTTQDSHAQNDSREWLTFLDLLRRWRPVQPINGVIVTVSVPDLLHGGAELEHQAAAVDRRLDELRGRLGLSFPVYLLVTKTDLLAGFVEFFGDYDARQREQSWGIGFELGAPTDGALPFDLPARLGDIAARIAAMAPQRLQDEPLAERRAAIYHFAAQVDGLLPPLEAFMRQAFRRCAQGPEQPVRGIHLSSGTQEGNPIDRVLGELSRGYGMALRHTTRHEQRGKAYFLASVLQSFVIAEAPLAGTNLARQKRRRWLTLGAAGVLGSLLVAACIGWAISYRSNAGYVASVRERLGKVVAQIDPTKAGRIDQLLPLYAALNQLAVSESVDPTRASWMFDFGLFQGPRLTRSAEQTYHRVLDRTLAPVLAERLSQALRQDKDPIARYDALRTALMLTTPARFDRAEVRRWAAQAFTVPLAAGPAASGVTVAQGPGAGEQQEWLRHLDALLERNAVLDVVRVDPAELKAARSALASVPLEERVHERLLARAREMLAGDQTLADVASPAAVVAFAPADAASGVPVVPAVYTRQAWREAIEPALETTLARVADEAGWVLGDRSPASQRLATDRAARDTLAQSIAKRHAAQAGEAWEKLLATIQVQVPGDADGLARLGTTLGAPASPLRQLLARVVSEFPEPAAGASPAAAAYDTALSQQFGALRDYARDGGAAIDKLVVPIAALLRDPAAQAVADLGRELRTEAGRAPAPLRGIWGGLAEALGAQQKRAASEKLGSGLAELAQACRRLTAERFPFSAEAKRDMPYADFARVFGPGGLLDGWFKGRLASQVDMRSRPWRMSGDAALPPQGQAALRSFEMAEDIRRLFFPSGAALPQLRLTLTPVGMDPDLLLFSADVDGQLLRYENGPRRPKTLVWPGPAATQKVLLRTLPPGPSDVNAEIHEGPWALLRVMQRRGWQRGSGGAAVARMEVDGRSLSLEVKAEGPVGAGLLGELSRFRCPEPW